MLHHTATLSQHASHVQVDADQAPGVQTFLYIMVPIVCECHAHECLGPGNRSHILCAVVCRILEVVNIQCICAGGQWVMDVYALEEGGDEQPIFHLLREHEPVFHLPREVRCTPTFSPCATQIQSLELLN